MRGRDVVWIYRRLEMKKWLSCNNRQSNSMQNTESNKGNVNYNRHNQLKLKSKCNGYFDKMSAQERKRRCQIPTIGVISCTERRGRLVHRAPVQGWMDQADATPVLVTASNTSGQDRTAITWNVQNIVLEIMRDQNCQFLNQYFCWMHKEFNKIT